MWAICICVEFLQLLFFIRDKLICKLICINIYCHEVNLYFWVICLFTLQAIINREYLNNKSCKNTWYCNFECQNNHLSSYRCLFISSDQWYPKLSAGITQLCHCAVCSEHENLLLILSFNVQTELQTEIIKWYYKIMCYSCQ